MAGKILIIDDDENSILLFRGVLVNLGYEVTVCTQPKNSVAIIKEVAPDMVLLDLVMPEKPGFEVLEDIREHHNSYELPVLILSGKNESEAIIEAFHRGANDYIHKTENFEISEARIRHHLQLRSLTAENLHLKEREVLSTMVATYNHEINNPLTVAKFYLAKLNCEDQKAYASLVRSIERIQTAVEKIKDMSHTTIQYESYGSGSKILSLKKGS